MDPRQRFPGPDHPITVEPTGKRVVARVGGRVIADTRDALTLTEGSYPPVQYVPLGDVDPDVLEESATGTYCPYKGEAGYYTLVPAQGTRLLDAVWTYRQPYDAVVEIAGRLAFYPDRVEIAVEDRPSERRGGGGLVARRRG